MLVKKGHIRWVIILLVMLGTIINYLSRSVFSVAAPSFMAGMGATEKEYGIITGIFQLGIMLQAVAGYILDFLKLRI
ncbi:MAG: MFS transporter, partial [Asticcacaulis sp.]